MTEMELDVPDPWNLIWIIPAEGSGTKSSTHACIGLHICLNELFGPLISFRKWLGLYLFTGGDYRDIIITEFNLLFYKYERIPYYSGTVYGCSCG